MNLDDFVEIKSA